MSGQFLALWRRIAKAAEIAADTSGESRDIAAALAAASMVDAISNGRRIPTPVPELCAQLAHAEVLAQRA